MEKLKALVIGGGFAGCGAAQVLVRKNYHVTLIEQGSYLGGGCKTHFYGGHPFTFGPRHFLTKKEHLWEYLNRYVPMRRIPDHEFWTYVERDGQFYHYPIHVDDVERMPDRDKVKQELASVKGAGGAKNLEEYWVGSVGPTLYSKFIENYSKKMWQINSNTELDDFAWSPKGVALKSGPIKAAWTEAMSGYPIKGNGYDDFFKIATQGAEVHFNTRIEAFDLEKYRVKVANEWHQYDLVVNSLAPEIVFNYAHGPLRWVGRDFQLIVLPVKQVFPENVYFLYYANQEPFTRIVEYKKFYSTYDSPTTLLGLEIPSANGKLYPMPTKADQAKAARYLDHLPKNVYSIGRAGSYRYDVDIDDILEQCLELEKKV